MFKDCDHARHGRLTARFDGRERTTDHPTISRPSTGMGARPNSRAGRFARLALSIGLVSGVVLANPVLHRLSGGWEGPLSREPLLIAAAAAGDVREARELLGHGAAVDARDARDGTTP